MNRADGFLVSTSRDADKIIQVLLEISSAVNSTFNLDELYTAIHLSLGKILNVDNLYIAIYNKEKNSLTARVLNQKKPLLFREQELDRMYRDSDKESIGFSSPGITRCTVNRQKRGAWSTCASKLDIREHVYGTGCRSFRRCLTVCRPCH